jgi:predicted 3-demethylubiquinone-9 3-methyltransferase (glyoxalase superfamily)
MHKSHLPSHFTQCLWFDNQGEAAAEFYTSLFKHSKIGRKAAYSESNSHRGAKPAGSVMTVEFQIAGLNYLALNGGPLFKFTPAYSNFVWCDTITEINALWQSLAEGGKARMEIDKYPWSERYGWVTDRFGLDWQLTLASNSQKIAPALLFVDDLFGKGQAALEHYLSIFVHAEVRTIARDETTNTIMHCVFSMAGQDFVLMEGSGTHNFKFNEAYSVVVHCETQAEIDEIWDKLSAVKEAEQCGWLKGKFGISWQVYPPILGDMLTDPDPEKVTRVTAALLKMKKIEIAELKRAYEG